MAQFTNQAQLSYNNSIVVSNVAVGELVEVLSATKTAVRGDYSAGDRITYVISIVNTGPAAFTGVTVNDNLGEYTFGDTTRVPLTYAEDSLLYFLDGVPQPTPRVEDEYDLTITGITVPAGGNALLIYEADVNAFAPLGPDDTIDNVVEISGNGFASFTVTESISTDDEPVLSITKSISPVPVTENGTLTYTFVIQNTGNRPITAVDDAVITDLFDPILANLNVTFNGEPWVQEVEYNYNEGTGLFTSVEGAITVPAATFTQNPVTGVWTTEPGVSTLVISGTI